eukprot:1156847-Pelagomonas_calceolata.AAC.3
MCRAGTRVVQQEGFWSLALCAQSCARHACAGKVRGFGHLHYVHSHVQGMLVHGTVRGFGHARYVDGHVQGMLVHGTVRGFGHLHYVHSHVQGMLVHGTVRGFGHVRYVDGFGGAGDEEAEGMLGTGGWTQQQQQQQQQQQRQRQRRHRQKRHVVQVDMWGPWAEASLTSMPPPAAGAPSSSTSPSSQGDHRGVTRGLQSHPPTMPKQEAQGGTATGPAGQQLHALSISDHQQRVETDTSAQRHAPSCHAHLSAYPQLHQQQQQQVDVGSLAAEVGALEALVVHAEALMAGCARSSHAQAVMLLTQGLARADRFAVRRAAPAAFAQGAPLSVPPTSADGDRSPVLVALGPLHALRIRLAATLMRAAVEEGSSWKIALQAACALTPIYEQLYPP